MAGKRFIAAIGVIALLSLGTPAAFGNESVLEPTTVAAAADEATTTGSSDSMPSLDAGDDAATPAPATPAPPEPSGPAASEPAVADSDDGNDPTPAQGDSAGTSTTEPVDSGPAPAPEVLPLAPTQPVTTPSPLNGSYCTVTFKLKNGAVPFDGTKGTTIHVEGTMGGTPKAPDQQNFYGQDNVSFYGMTFDSGTDITFIINYITAENRSTSSGGNRFGKITGTYKACSDDAGDLTATDVSGARVAATIDAKLGDTAILTLDDAWKRPNVVESTGSYGGISLARTPANAEYRMTDADGTWLPLNWERFLGFSPPMPATEGTERTFGYSVFAEGFDNATGSFTIKRVKNKPVYAHSPDGNAKSAELTEETGPTYKLSVELKPGPRTETTVNIGVIAPQKVTPTVTMTGPGGFPVNPTGLGRTFTILKDGFNATYDYAVTADGMRAFRGQLFVDVEGIVTDITSDAAKEDVIAFKYDLPTQAVTVQLRPAPSAVAVDKGVATVDISDQLNYLFADSLTLYDGDPLLNGQLEVVNPLPYDVVVTDMSITGEAKLAHDVLRTKSEVTKPVLGAGAITFTGLRDIAQAASVRYGQTFDDYSDYVLYFFQNNLGGFNKADYSQITDLRQMDPRDQAAVFASNHIFGVNDTFMKFDLEPTEPPFGVEVIQSGDRFAMIEPDPVLTELAYDLLFEDSFFFTLDSTKAAEARMPRIHDDVASEKWDGLQFMSYLDRTDANHREVAKVIDGITIPAGGSHIFKNVAMSTIGSYIHNGFDVNSIDFDFDIKLEFSPVGIDGYLFEDINKSKAFDEGDKPMPGIGVELRSTNEKDPLVTTTTDADGHYIFPHGTGAGAYPYDINTNYYTQFELPDGHELASYGGTGQDDNRFTLFKGSARSDFVKVSFDELIRLNGGLIAQEAPPTDDPTTPSTPPASPTLTPTPPAGGGPGGVLPTSGVETFGILAIAFLVLVAGGIALWRRSASRW